MKLIKVIAFLAVVSSTFAGFAQEEFGRRVGKERAFAHHNLQVNLTPSAHFLQAVDEVTLTDTALSPITFRLRDTMLITGVFGEDGRELDVAPAKGQAEVLDGDGSIPEHLVSYELELPEKLKKFSISYEGEIYDPIEEATTLAFVRGDETTGIIDEEGIYLDAGSGWYPLEDGGLATFELEVMVEEPFVTVAQGDLVERSRKEAGGVIEISRWESDVPQDNFTLVGNKFIVKTRQVGDISTSAYFFEEDASLADEYLDATAEYLEYYQKLLGKFPYNRFDIVENFFQTGYGMPGYTLLGSAVIKMHYTGEFAIGHELMHNWWGNYVFYDADKGNWCEAITTYLTNYYWLEASGQTEKAREWRKHASVKYSINVPPDKAYPLKDFRGKENEIDGAIGYEKGAMFFHGVRRLVGDDAFFSGLREVIDKRGGDFADWEDFKSAFKSQVESQEPEKDYLLPQVDQMFEDWLKNPDAPGIEMAQVRNEPGIFEVALSQTDPSFLLPLDVIGWNADGTTAMEATIILGSDEGKVSIESKKRRETGELVSVAKVEIDPEWHVFRRVPVTAIEPCLNAVLNEEDAYVVYPSGTDALSSELARLVPILEGSGRRLRIVSDAQFEADAEMSDGQLESSVFVLGGGTVNSAWKALKGIVPPGVFSVGRDSFSVGREVYDGQMESVLLSVANPMAPGTFVSVYHGNSAEALVRARYIFYYGWDSYVIFKEGRPSERGIFPALENPWVWEAEEAQ